MNPLPAPASATRSHATSSLTSAPAQSPTFTSTTHHWTGAALGGENPQPIFRTPHADTPIRVLDGLSPELSRKIGHGCGRRVLPYRMQDRYNRERKERGFRGVVLDNGILRAVFLPELGGRLISLVHQPDGRELLFNNPVFQPANLALRDAWFAGGIEWNIGQFGHAYHTCAPVFAARIPGIDGGCGLRLYDYDRLKGSFWQIDLHLPPGSHFLYAFTRVINPRDEPIDLYWWTNMAVQETPGLRVLAPADESVFVSYADPSGRLGYGQAPLPGLPTIGGDDGTYPENLDFTNEFFFQCQKAEMPWEAALDAHGRGLVEASTAPLKIRKVFAWGMHPGGRRWQKYLSAPGQSYLEIQAGLAPTQQHTVPLAAGGDVSWTQAFGPLEVDPAIAHHADWATARTGVAEALGEHLTLSGLMKTHEACLQVADAPLLELVQSGSGWGALEVTRRRAAELPDLPAAWTFPPQSMGTDQQRWLWLLDHEHFPEQDPGMEPGEWMIQPEWQDLLEASSKQAGHRHWYALLHLGVMRMEAGEDDAAVAAWEESMRLKPSAWACRNLAVAAHRRGDITAALTFSRQTWDLARAAGRPDISFAIEHLTLLEEARLHEEAWDFHGALDREIRDSDPVRLLAAKAAFERDDLDFVDQVLAHEFGSIREGARDLTDLWFGVQTKRLAIERNCAPDDELLNEVKRTLRPPFPIDFRIFE